MPLSTRPALATGARLAFGLVGLQIVLFAAPASLIADVFTYRDETGTEIEVEARLAGSGQGAHALELADGELQLVPQAGVIRRVPGDDPTPLSHDEVARQLAEEFGEETFRSHIEEPFVIGLVLDGPLPKRSESHARGFLKKVGRFMKAVERTFMNYVGDARLATTEPRYPLVVLVFETDRRFDEYAQEVTGGELTAQLVSGFYSTLSNHLVIRMSECQTFETPLHEGIHQQVHNRGLFQRLAPIPVWFNEGIATGFEGNGERISIGPARISTRYARMALAARTLDWNSVVEDDSAFSGDVLMGEAYGHAWSLHWLLVTEYRSEYIRYMQLLSAKEPLSQDADGQRKKEFESTFGKSVDELQAEFSQRLASGLKKQRLPAEPEHPAGVSVTQSDLGEVEMRAVQNLNLGGVLEVQGRLRNLSSIRPMAFHVTVITSAGTYTEWLVPELGIRDTAPLRRQIVQKVLPNARGGLAGTYRVRVRAVPADSPESQSWRNGRLPPPQ